MWFIRIRSGSGENRFCPWEILAAEVANLHGKKGVAVTGQAKIADYSAAKAGVIGFTKSIAREVGSFGINVNCVAPGFIATEAVLSQNSDDFLKKGMSQILLPREGTPEDVGNVVAFLCSEEADYITGEVILVGGGGYLG